jgi:hypothetical protein
MFKESFAKQWYETYWAFDLHGTIIRPTYLGTEMIFYPYALETLKFIDKHRPDIKKILWTSSFPNEIDEYMEEFRLNKVSFNSINSNPGISSNKGNFGYYEQKFYFNILFEDKSGFNPEVEWESIYNLFTEYERIGYKPNPSWSTKF